MARVAKVHNTAMVRHPSSSCLGSVVVASAVGGCSAMAAAPLREDPDAVVLDAAVGLGGFLVGESPDSG